MMPTITYCTPSARPVIRRRSDLGSEFDRLFDGFFGPARGSGSDTRRSGAADLHETDDQFVLELEIPGFTKEEIEVTVERGVLTVSGSHEQVTEDTDDADDAEEDVARDEKATYHIRERSFERFTRAFKLSESVSAEGVLAQLEDGVLTVRLPKAAEAKPRRVEISAN
jgi:HSP20 family protein